MKISDIKPYPRNARHNEKAIPAVAQSIKDYGLRGTIGLRSKAKPVIVWGHTRVEACKSLGWLDIPDEKIEFCDDLTDEQVKEFRIAGNKTGDIATYNKAMLREEIRSLKNFDTKKFGFEFKSKYKPYGAERLKTDSAYNLELVNRFAYEGEYPPLQAVDAKPAEFMGFNYAKSTAASDKHGKACHFFIDDYQFERLWTSPARYVDILRDFECVLTPDFSLYLDMPRPMMQWNRYRSQALGFYWQCQGLSVVPTLTWGDEDTFDFTFEGMPEGGTVAVSTVGVKKDKEAQKFWCAGMSEALRRTKPARVFLYGSAFDFDFGSVEVVEYKAGGFHGK